MREGAALTERSFRPISLSYQSFRAHIPDNSSTAEMVTASRTVIAGATQIKIVGVILLGFSLMQLQNPISDGYLTWYDPAAKSILGLAIAITFMTTTYTMCEAHYLSTLSSVAGTLANKEKDDSMNEEDGPVSEDDQRLASKFRALLADLEILRGWTRAGLWLSMLLLVLATLLRLGRGDLGFVFIGIVTVVLVLGASAWPVVMRLRNLYAPLIKEYRGLAQAGA